MRLPVAWRDAPRATLKLFSSRCYFHSTLTATRTVAAVLLCPTGRLGVRRARALIASLTFLSRLSNANPTKLKQKTKEKTKETKG